MISIKTLKIRCLFSLRRSFASTHHAEKPGSHPEKAEHCPKKHDDHHHSDSHDAHPTVQPYEGPINQTQFVKIFPNEENPHFTKSLYNVCGHLTKFRPIFSLFYNNLTASKTQEVSEYWNPPKIHENSVFVYQSKRLGNSVRYVRGGESILAAYVVFFCPHPIFYAAFASLVYTLWLNAFFYETTRRLVVRMDLLPHIEMVNMQKVGAFGRLYNKLVRIQDLEKVPFAELKDKENFYWEMSNYVVDKHLIFRDKSTGELFCFDQKGVWSDEGLNHKLLN